MQLKINKEIRDFKESIFFGLSMRQFRECDQSCVSNIRQV